MSSLLRKSQPATGYEDDFYAWTQDQASRVRTRRFADLDLENIAEELETLGRSDKREIRSRLNIVLVHLLKWQFQPQGRSGSWGRSLVEQRYRLLDLLEESPSLRDYPGIVLDREYPIARMSASAETGLALDTFPNRCPYGLDKVLDLGYLPGSAQP